VTAPERIITTIPNAQKRKTSSLPGSGIAILGAGSSGWGLRDRLSDAHIAEQQIATDLERRCQAALASGRIMRVSFVPH
jgi:hypothetical protein